MAWFRNLFKRRKEFPFKLKRVYSYSDLPETKSSVGLWDSKEINDINYIDLIYNHIVNSKELYYYVNYSIEGKFYSRKLGWIYLEISSDSLSFGVYKSSVRYDIRNLKIHEKLYELINKLNDTIREEYEKDLNL